QVVGDAGTPQHRPAGAVSNGVLGGEVPDALDARLEDAVAGQQVVVFADLALQVVEEAGDVLHEPVVEVVADPADPQVVVEHAGPGQLAEDIQQVLPLPPGVQERRGGAQVQGKGSEPNQMAGDALQFVHDDADILRPLGNLHAGQPFGGHDQRRLAGDGRQVVGTVGVGDDLTDGPLFSNLLEATVQVTNVGDRLDHLFALKAHHNPQDPVGAGVLRPHIDEQLILPDLGGVGQDALGGHLLLDRKTVV